MLIKLPFDAEYFVFVPSQLGKNIDGIVIDRILSRRTASVRNVKLALPPITIESLFVMQKRSV